MAFLDIRGVSHTFGKMPVLRDIDLRVEEGEFVALVGPSGCGKSTLLNLVAGLERVQSGDIALGGASIVARPPAERDIAMVFQSYALYPHMTVRDNLAFGLKMRGVARAARAAAIGEVAELLKLGELLERRPRELSGGQRQRVAMGRALVRRPKLFLFDEPLSNLDAQLRVELRALVKRLHRQFKTTTVYVTHDQVEAMTLAERIAVLDGGRLQQVGTPDEIYREPQNLLVARLIGSPAMNLLPGTLVVEGARSAARVALADGGAVLLPLRRAAGSAESGRDVLLGLRPEALGGGSGQAVIPGRVELVERTGADTYIRVRVGQAEVVARSPADAAPPVGAYIRLAVAMESCVLFDPATGARLAEL